MWSPTPAGAQATNVAHFMTDWEGGASWTQNRTDDPQQDWPLFQELSWSQPERFWSAVIKTLGIRFDQLPSRILEDDSEDPDRVRWLPGARTNIAGCALASPLADLDSPAVIWAREGAPTHLGYVSRRELLSRCARLATAIRMRFSPGDALAINLPMTRAAVEIYLSIILAGCVVVSIADSFAGPEILTRLRIARAKGIFTQDVILRGGKQLPLYSRVKEVEPPCIAIVLPAHTEGDLVVPLRGQDMSWKDFLAPVSCGQQTFTPYIADAAASINILFSSGTTGAPKAIPWNHITPLRAATDSWAHMDLKPGQVLCWPTNLGWMMGPWLVFAALLNGATMALYEGAPLGRDFGVFVEAARVNVLGLVPSIVKAWRHSGCMSSLDWSPLQCYASTGEASAPEDYHWLMSRVKGYRPVVEYCGGTEIGGAFLTGVLVQPQSASTFSTPALGVRLVLLAGDEQMSQSHEGVAVGELALIPPILGISQRLLNKDHRATYYQSMPLCSRTGRRLRRHGDEMRRMRGGYYCALGRCDDTMNLGGIKVASVELERVVQEKVEGVAEVAAVGMPTAGGGPEQLHLFVVLKPNVDPEAVVQILAHCQVAIRQHLNPLFKVEQVALRKSLPRNASNKVMRRLLRDEVIRPKL